MSFYHVEVKSRLTLILGLVFAVFSTEAQALSRVEAAICVREAFNLGEGVAAADLQEGDVLQGLAPGEAKQEILYIKLKMATLFEIKVVPCKYSENANAFYSVKDDGLPPDYTGVNYILYDQDWVKDKVKSQKTELDFILGHEFGHLINAHDTTRKYSVDQKTKELEADYAGGCAVARMGRPWAPLKALVSDIRSIPSDDYASAETSLLWAKRGYTNCGGRLDTLYDGVRVVYFVKDADDGLVTGVLDSKEINYEKAVSSTSTKTNGMTCTNDYNFKLVRDLAIDLTKAGVEIYWINTALPELHANHRITIEAEDDDHPDWVPLSVSQLSCMKSCRWWTSEVDACGG